MQTWFFAQATMYALSYLSLVCYLRTLEIKSWRQLLRIHC